MASFVVASPGPALASRATTSTVLAPAVPAATHAQQAVNFRAGVEDGAPHATGTGSVLVPAAAVLAAVSSANAVRKGNRRRAAGAEMRSTQRLSLNRTALQASYDADAWRRGFREYPDVSPPDSYYFIEGVKDLPTDLVGTYFRTGPGKFDIGETGKVAHQMDGDGVVMALGFNGDGEVCVRHRLVQTQGLLRDKLEKRKTSDGAYGTRAEGGFLGGLGDVKNERRKNTANGGMVYFKERLLALHEFGKPHLVDTGSLGTIIGNQDSGASDLAGQLLDKAGFGPTPRLEANYESLVNMGQAASPLGTTVTFLDWKPDGDWTPRFKYPREFNVSTYTHFSDYAVTKKYFVLAQPPLKLVDSLGAGLDRPLGEVCEADPSGQGEFIVASRDKGGAAGRFGGKQITIPGDVGLFCSECANAYETEDGKVIFDLVATDRWEHGSSQASRDARKPHYEVEDPSKAPRGTLLRYELDLKSETFSKKELCKRHLGYVVVNPSVCGKQHKFVFCGIGHDEDGVGPLAGLAKVDVETGAVDAWVPGPTEFASQQAQFVAKEGAEAEDDGYLITVINDGKEGAERSDVAIFDAKNISQGPVCRFALKDPVPHGTRGCWAKDVVFTQKEVKRKMTLLKMFLKKTNTWNSVETKLNLLGGGMFMKQGGEWR
eukprot:TRINITY_DN74417_c0_g1_i1.p1 TRINITY_DN74417_c0_g1~~TRINITY_DN74417_c0_g1_i1.p1  ORF type:complete len:659 (+),score=153.92 TRINITY_DN74417_c0_g1_i1:111-2087(+)